MMRHLSLVAAVLSLAACSGGGGVSTGAPFTAPGSGSGSSGGSSSSKGLVTPSFEFIVTRASQAQSTTGRRPDFVSSATQSVTITLTNAPIGLAPTSVTTAVAGTSCTVATPCVVQGPPSPPGVSDTFLVQTFASVDGSGSVLDTGTVSATPTAGQANTITITLDGVPATIALTNSGTFTAGSTTAATAITATVKDAAGVTITGTYSTPVLITDPDNNGTQGTQVAGTAPTGGCAATTTCAQLTGNTSTATVAYGGLAEGTVTITGSATGATSGTFTITPTLAAIVHSAGPTSVLSGAPFGIDLYTTNATSTVGYTGTESYSEAGYTNSPYFKTLTETVTSGNCTGFATLAAPAANTTSGATDFKATAIAAATSGVCTLAVGDGVHTTGLPTFDVDYTTSGIGADSAHRK